MLEEQDIPEHPKIIEWLDNLLEGQNPHITSKEVGSGLESGFQA